WSLSNIEQRVDLVTAQLTALAQRLGAVAEPVSLASRYCTLPSRRGAGSGGEASSSETVAPPPATRPASRATAAVRRLSDRLIELFDNKVALARDHVAAHAGARHFTDMLCNAGLAIHEHVQIVGVEDQKARARDRGDGGRPTRAMQRRHLAEEMPSTEPHALVLELDLHFTGGDEVHGMRGLAAPDNDVPRLDLLRVQQPHDVGDLGRLKVRE